MAKRLRDIVNFTQEDLQKLLAARRMATDLIPVMDEAEQCGEDCALFRQAVAAADANLAMIQELAMPRPQIPGQQNGG